MTRREREWKTVVAMLRLACRDWHGGPELCAGCSELRAYAEARLQRCVFGEEKPTCASCPIHCYARAHRERMREVMRYAGPRMLRAHPILAIRHLLDGRRPTPPIPRRRAVAQG